MLGLVEAYAGTTSAARSWDPGEGGEALNETPTAAAHTEVELKLGGSEKDLAAFEKAVVRLSGGTAKWRREKLSSRYYDTVDLRLFGRHAVLRVRRSSKGYVQTVKAAGSEAGAVMSRAEWEQPVAGAKPDLEALPGEARECVGLLLEGELKPVVDVDVVRRKTVIRRERSFGGEAEIEAVIDQGTVKAGGKSEPIAECELELLTGDPRDLFEAALELCKGTRLHVVMEAKSSRGYDMILDRKPVPEKVAKAKLVPRMAVSEALAAILRASFGSALKNEQPAYDGADPEGVHQLRVSIRRMRSVLSVFSHLVDAERVAWVKDELKWLMGTLGPARDWDVFIGETLGSIRGVGIDENTIAVLARAAGKKRTEGYRQVRATLRMPRYTELLLGLSGFIETRGWATQPIPEGDPLLATVGDTAPELLNRAYRKVVKLGNRLDELEMEERHELRKRLKKLRYTVDFLQGLYPAEHSKPFLKRLSRLQDQFGYMNDIAVAERLTADAVKAGDGTPAHKRKLAAAAAQVMGWHARGLHDMEATLADDWKAFKRVKPFWRH